jgi:hypothetical protein
MIPKPGGGERPLGIPTIKDRVVQTAAKLVLEPIFEADLDPEAYGYRPQRSALDAVRRVHGHLRAGYTDVVDADLSKYFDTIPHGELLECVARRVSDAGAGPRQCDWRPSRGTGRGPAARWWQGIKRGTPQVASSPLLASICEQPQVLVPERSRAAARGPMSSSIRRSRHPLPQTRGRGARGVEGGDDGDGADRQRDQDQAA